MPQIRLDKLLSDMGIASRKESRAVVKSGRVTVDGSLEKHPERKVDPTRETVALDGEALQYRAHHYYMMNKPLGIVTATEDREQKTVLDLMPSLCGRGIFPVGRLDKDTDGLLILTDDGEFAHRVISPKSCVEKLYYAKVEGEPDAEDTAAFACGLVLADGTRCLPALLEPLGDQRCLVRVVEGKYHQVRRMLAARGKPVRELRRLAIGELCLEKDLAPGAFRELTEADLCKLFCAVPMEKWSKTTLDSYEN